MKITTLDQLLEDEVKDIYSAENQLLKALPRMAEAAESKELRASFEKHLEQTQTHVQRIEEICRDLKVEPSGKTCAGMGGLLKEGEEVIESDMESEPKQAALIGAAQRVEHYEIAAYGTAIAHARLLGHQEIAKLFEASLAEEKAADRKLTAIAEGDVNIGAVEATLEEEPTRLYRSRAGRQERATAQSSPRRAKKAARGRKAARKIR
jgi:ferritin-like metal-binding protein YciE